MSEADRGSSDVPGGEAHDGHEHVAGHDPAEHHHGEIDWDEFYAVEADGAPIWSGQVNGTLVVEVAEMAPGTVLDVGCGEGGDAIWLARQGWTVTAVEPSAIAVGRARAAAQSADVHVTWVHAGLLDMPGGTGQYDLVSAQYPALMDSPDNAAITALMAAVAPGGTLLLVHHDMNTDTEDHDHGHDHGSDHEGHGFDPADYVMPADVAEQLDDEWDIEVNETRDRPGDLADARHARDIVLRARRRSN